MANQDNTTTNPRPVTLLFCPAHRPERFDKALRAGAPGIVLDLEDGVGAEAKDGAREAAFDWLAGQAARDTPQLLCLRINDPGSPAGLEDVHRLTQARALPGTGWLLLPKVEDAALLRWTAGHLLRRAPGWRLCALVETPTGLRRVHGIARAHPAVAALAFGGADLRAELGAEDTWEALLYARSRFVAEAAGCGHVLLDVPHIAIDDEPGLREQARRARALGFHGKLAIHPRQVGPLLECFGPTPAEREAARRIVAAYEACAGNACQVDGRMVDEPVYQQARALLAS
jgi:citrate lyase beta subunit